jgi:hypothetical protein
MGQRGITDLARCGSCGIPSAWRSPTTRRPRGSPRRNRCVCHVALPLGCRVVALGGGRRDAPPCPPRPSRSDCCCPAIPEACLPARVWCGRACCVCCCKGWPCRRWVASGGGTCTDLSRVALRALGPSHRSGHPRPAVALPKRQGLRVCA